jgi:membrane-anchored glycerophosphoryl diester phosphodiesterase (GDPDase)
MWDKIDRFIEKLNWHTHLIIGLCLSFVIGWLGEWAIFALLIFTLISTYVIQIGLISLFQFMLRQKKVDENEIPNDLWECIKLFKSQYIK